MSPGALALVLYAHLPFVRHASEARREEWWLHHALTGSYLPLLELLTTLERDAVPVRITWALSPPLLAMLSDPLLRSRYLRHLDGLVELAEREERRTRGQGPVHHTAQADLRRFWRLRTAYLEWREDLLAVLRGLQDAGILELIPSGATHGFLPVLAGMPGATRAQIAVAAAEHRRTFARPAEGFWLPECGYTAGVDDELARAGIRYCVLETHGLAHATPRPFAGVYAPAASPSGVALFARDPDTTRELGLAGRHPCYRASTHDIGFELDHAYVEPYLPPDGERVRLGISYDRQGDGSDARAPYDLELARRQVQADAAAFVARRRAQIAWLARHMDRVPTLVVACPTELFGQAWFEGPDWLELVLRQIAADGVADLLTPTDELLRRPTIQMVTPAPSSRSVDGYSTAWLNQSTDWLYPALHAASERLRQLCRRHPDADDRTRRALTQALRELLLAQASDWPALLVRPATAAYAGRRVREHLARCDELCAAVERSAIDDAALAGLEEADNIFPALDYRAIG